MDAESKGATRVLEALAVTTEQLIDLKRQVQSYPEVLHVQHALGLRSYQTGPVVEAYVDAELASGNAVGWWLEIHWDKARWLIESSIRLDHEGGEDTITAFPPRKAVTLTELLDQLKASVIELGEFVAIVRATVQ